MQTALLGLAGSPDLGASEPATAASGRQASISARPPPMPRRRGAGEPVKSSGTKLDLCGRAIGRRLLSTLGLVLVAGGMAGAGGAAHLRDRDGMKRSPRLPRPQVGVGLPQLPDAATMPTSPRRDWLRCREDGDQRAVHAGVAPVVVEDLGRLKALDDQVDTQR